MDWGKLKDAIEAICRETIRADKSVFANLAIVCELLDFIPADPNKEADAEWLKERGWVKSKDMHLYIANKRLGLVFEDNIGGLRLRMIDTQRVYYNPTRMTVALFEAAARESMRHGE